jgi:hypothetical protein
MDRPIAQERPGWLAGLQDRRISSAIPARWICEALDASSVRASRVCQRFAARCAFPQIPSPVTCLKSQTYLLEVTGISDRGVAEGERGYPFRVVKQ